MAIAPMARSVADVELLFNVLRGPDHADRTTLMGAAASAPMRQRLRVRYFPTVEGKPVDPVIAAGVATATRRLEAMGHDVSECAAPYTLAEMETIWSVLIASGTAAARRGMPETLPALTEHTVIVAAGRSQHQNRTQAMQILRSRLYELERERLASERAADRKGQVGSGDRSERIRTYNFPQGRVTDHRINLTLYKLESVVTGEALDEIIEPLITEHQASLLAALDQ